MRLHPGYCGAQDTFYVAIGSWTRRKSDPTKRGKGVKIIAIVDRHGLPLSVSTHAAKGHDIRPHLTRKRKNYAESRSTGYAGDWVTRSIRRRGEPTF